MARLANQMKQLLNSAVFPGQQGGPLMHVIAGKAVAFKVAASYMLQEDRIEHWLTYIEHSKISISAYYLSKIFRVLLNFMVAIIVTFCVGAFVRDVELPLSGWLGSGALLLLSSLVFLAFGLLIAQIKSQQIMSVVANITYLGLAIVGGSWMPISMFPKWVQSISEWTPVYHVNELVVNFAKDGTFSWKSLLFILAYTVVVTGLALFIKSQRESDRG